MKRLLLSLAICLSVIVGTSSCGMLVSMGMGSIVGNRSYLDGTANQTDTKVLLQQGNFKVLGLVEGSASAKYVFGIGGLSEQAVKGNAISNMYENANLQGPQAIINVSFTRHDKSILVYNEAYWTCQGLKIEFTAPLKKKCKKSMEAPVQIVAQPVHVSFTKLSDMLSDDNLDLFKKASPEDQAEYLKAAVSQASATFKTIKTLNELRTFEQYLDCIDKFYYSTTLDSVNIDTEIRALRRKVAYVRSAL